MTVFRPAWPRMTILKLSDRQTMLTGFQTALDDLFSRSRREGLTAIESDIEEPEKSKTFSAYPAVIRDHYVLRFICDTLRTARAEVSALSTVADSLPGPGIVAAVLGGHYLGRIEVGA